MNIILNKEISFFKNTFESTSELISLSLILSNIKSGVYKNEIESLRLQKEQSNDKEYSRLKSNLPAVTFSGSFKEKRQLTYLNVYSSIIVFDIDKLEKDNLRLFLDQLKNDSMVLCCWVSPSNNGIKFLVVTNGKVEDHKKYFQVLKKIFENKYGFEIDKSGSDPSRLCYISYDPSLSINENPILITDEFLVKHHVSIELTKPNIKKISIPDAFSKKNRLFDSTGKNKQSDRDTLKKIIKFLEKNKKSITSSYNDWFRVACSISNTFTHEVGRKYYIELCKLDGASHNNEESEKMILSVYQNGAGIVNFSTIIYLAQQQGFDLQKAGVKNMPL